MEKELIKRSKAGDEEAFTELVKLHQSQIFHQCLGVLHDKEAAEDVMQETFIRAFQHIQDFEERSSFYTWIWRIAHNLIVDYIRKTRSFAKIEEAQIVDDKTADFDDLASLLPLLGRKHQAVFKLYYLDHLTQKEIAQSLNIPYGTVRSRLHHIKKKLARLRQKF